MQALKDGNADATLALSCKIFWKAATAGSKPIAALKGNMPNIPLNKCTVEVLLSEMARQHTGEMSQLLHGTKQFRGNTMPCLHMANSIIFIETSGDSLPEQLLLTTTPERSRCCTRLRRTGPNSESAQIFSCTNVGQSAKAATDTGPCGKVPAAT